MTEEERIRTYELLFEHPGWSMFIEEFVTAELASLPDKVFKTATDWDQVVAGRAAYSKLQEIEAVPLFIAAQADDVRAEGEVDDG